MKLANIGSGSAFVLAIGDEGAVLVQLSGGRVIKRLFAQSSDVAYTREFEKAILNSPKTPITILFDVADQSYIRQTLPPVSSLNMWKIINRRLSRDFAPDDIKGYVVLDREKGGRKDWNYMIVSLLTNAILQKWLSFATEQPNPLKAMALLPMECQRLIKELEKRYLKDREKGAKPSEWQIFVSHNKVGGFRQVVLRNEKLVFTRMTQSFGDSAELIAGNIEQETINTLEYLKRFGLQDPSLVSMTVVCAEEIKKSIDPAKLRVGQTHLLTPYETAQLLSLKDAAQLEDNFGDVLICAFVAKQKKLILPLFTPYTKKLRSLSMYLLHTRLVGTVVILAILGWIGSNALDLSNRQTDDLSQQRQSLESDISRVKAKFNGLPKDANAYSDVATLGQSFLKGTYDVNTFAIGLSQGTRDLATISDLEWVLKDPLMSSPTSDKRKVEATVKLHVLLPPMEPLAKVPADLKALEASIRAHLPAFAFSDPEVPGLSSEGKNIKTVLGSNENSDEVEVTKIRNTDITIVMSGPGTAASKK